MSTILLEFGPTTGSIDHTFIQTTHGTIRQLHYFRNIPKTCTRLFIDRDKDATLHVLERVRNGPHYTNEVADWEWFNSNTYQKEDIVKLNIGGTIFHTTKSTLLNTPSIFQAHLSRWSVNKDEIFLDRDPKAFRHVLSRLRNPDYPFPPELNHELQFYCLTEPESDAIEEPNKILLSNHSTSTINGANNIICLVAHGMQDVMLYSQPQYSHYHPNLKPQPVDEYLRCSHTARQLFTTLPRNDGGWGRRIVIRVAKNADIYDKLFLRFNFKEPIPISDVKYPDQFIFSMIQRIRLECNGECISQFSGQSLDMMYNMFYQKEYQLFQTKYGHQFFILPLHFLSHCLYIISAGYAEINIEIELCLANQIFENNYSPDMDMQLITNGIFLDSDERRSLTQLEHQHHTIIHLYNSEPFVGNQLYIHLPPLTTQILFAITMDEDDKFNYLEDVFLDGRIEIDHMSLTIPINPFVSDLHKIINKMYCKSPIYYFSLLDMNKEMSHDLLRITLSLKLNFSIPSGRVQFYFGQHNQTFYQHGSFLKRYSP